VAKDDFRFAALDASTRAGSEVPTAHRHLTPYASSKPCEDFAETFHYYLRHKGRLPIRLQNKFGIVQKWEFIASLAS
jgi:hypothetical protein